MRVLTGQSTILRKRQSVLADDWRLSRLTFTGFLPLSALQSLHLTALDAHYFYCVHVAAKILLLYRRNLRPATHTKDIC